jgi:hypothetical protein
MHSGQITSDIQIKIVGFKSNQNSMHSGQITGDIQIKIVGFKSNQNLMHNGQIIGDIEKILIKPINIQHSILIMMVKMLRKDGKNSKF